MTRTGSCVLLELISSFLSVLAHFLYIFLNVRQYIRVLITVFIDDAKFIRELQIKIS